VVKGVTQLLADRVSAISFTLLGSLFCHLMESRNLGCAAQCSSGPTSPEGCVVALRFRFRQLNFYLTSFKLSFHRSL
jgi:hypothetical protein